jgi:arginine decarboxylase
LKKTKDIHPKELPTWSIDEARELYGINRWGLKYFDISSDGDVTVAPLKDKGISIKILDVIMEAREEGLHFPMLIRFQDLLRDRVERINNAFQEAIREFGYQSEYRGVYPIKVNQLREVVEEIVDAGKPYRYGLEAGSKPELIAALAYLKDPESLIICNGYKDHRYIQTALIGSKLGKKVVLVVEKVEEVRNIIELAKEYKVNPILGVRLRLASKGQGKWYGSTGDEAKFGLTASEILETSALLKDAGMEHCLKLVHFHIGSQVPDIIAIKNATREAAMYYAKLKKLGHDLEYIDVGGGLGVDYDGSRSTFHSSVNYSLNEYARDIIYNILEICDQEQVPHPIAINESGRAVVSHHSVLVVEAFGHIKKTRDNAKITKPTSNHKLAEDAWFIYENIKPGNPLEAYHDALHLKDEAQTHFGLGLIGLEVKAEVERFFWLTCEAVLEHYKGTEYIPEEIVELESNLSGQYLCNFSVFQSLLDHWGFGQLFPVMPLHRLNEEPTERGTLVDITCDSDGKVSKFINHYEEGADTLQLHKLNDTPYYLGFFLTAAYQDIMGDLHNLFGRVNEAHVFLEEDEESGYYIEETIQGTTMGNVLGLVQYDAKELTRKMKKQFDRAIKNDHLKPKEGMKLLKEYEKALKEYTYLDLK